MSELIPTDKTITSASVFFDTPMGFPYDICWMGCTNDGYRCVVTTLDKTQYETVLCKEHLNLLCPGGERDWPWRELD